MSEPGRSGRGGWQAPWPLTVAWRYLRSGRKDSYVSFLSGVAVGGIALGVAALILSLSALNGLQRGLRAEVLGRTPEIEVELPDGADVTAARRAIEGVDRVGRVTPRLRGNGWVLMAGSARPVAILGFEGELPATLPATGDRVPGVYVSDRFARLQGLSPGDLLEVASTRSHLTPLGPMPRVRRLPLAGTFEHAALEIRDSVALPLAAAEDLIGARSLHLVVETGDLDVALAVAGELRQVLPPGSRVRTWRDLNGPLLLALELEKRLMFVAVFLIVLVASLALVSDLSLLIASRRAEIGILGTIGAAAASLRAAFLAVGAFLALGGVVAGSALGWVLCLAFDRWSLIRLPGEAFLMDHVPFLVEPGDVAWVAAATLGVALVCCWIGAAKAASLRPVEALRS